eukprot:scaffold7694_cov116-Isochrysis_galbana.AAC.2
MRCAKSSASGSPPPRSIGAVGASPSSRWPSITSIDQPPIREPSLSRRPPGWKGSPISGSGGGSCRDPSRERRAPRAAPCISRPGVRSCRCCRRR